MTKIIAVLILSLSASFAFACGNKSDITFVWIYDKQDDMFYLADYKASAGNYNEVIPTSNGAFSFALRHDAEGNVTATAVRTAGTAQKTYRLTGKVYGLNKCLGSAGIVRWNQEEFNDWKNLPQKYRSAMLQYERDVLGE